ncbi:gamma-glutamyltransferase, partial [Staphylococcus aureus]|nr:gamma-glutamyltransferase [Staphylococcus aureus]
GPEYFYEKVGKSVSKQVDEEVNEKDFASYKTEKKEPVSTDYLNNKVYSASNPLGGTLMLQGLEIDEATGNDTTPDNRLDYITGMLKSR